MARSRRCRRSSTRGTRLTPRSRSAGISGSIKIEEIAASVAGGAPPDMVITCNNQAVPGFAHDGVIQPLDDLITQVGGDTSNIIPASLDWVKYQGKLYGLPFLQDDWGFAWNTDAFTAAGLDPGQAADHPRRAVERCQGAHDRQCGRFDQAGRLHPVVPGQQPYRAERALRVPLLRRGEQEDHGQQPGLRGLVRLVQEVQGHVRQEGRTDEPHREQGLRG